MDQEINLDKGVIQKFKGDPIYFIYKIWNLTPQSVLDEYKNEVSIYIKNAQWDKIKVEHFDIFVKGKHISWQQWLMLLAVERALVYGDNKISVVSGHGTGKDTTLSWIIIWFLFCHADAQVGATAPTSEQIHDVLWKEVALWMGRMPKELQELFEWQSSYIRVRERPETWFARARTARKESPEAIAGLHGDHVLLAVDEASGVPDEIYRSAEGSMTGPNILVFLIGNGTRNSGYFYDTHNDEKEMKNWQRFSFSSEESPVVEEGYVERMESKYSRDSDEFRLRVLGGFPSSEQMDDAGWIPLIIKEKIHLLSPDVPFTGRKIMAIDPAGEGDDKTIWIMRDNYQSRVIASETVSNTKSIAMKTLDLIKEHELDPRDVIIDNFGIGANVSAELLLLDHTMHITAMNWGQDAQDTELFLNSRAECCFRARDWLIGGGGIVGDELKRDILAYTYRTTLKGKRQIREKVKIKKVLGRSPDRGDAFFMTFLEETNLRRSEEDIMFERHHKEKVLDPFATI